MYQQPYATEYVTISIYNNHSKTSNQYDEITYTYSVRVVPEVLVLPVVEQDRVGVESGEPLPLQAFFEAGDAVTGGREVDHKGHQDQSFDRCPKHEILTIICCNCNVSSNKQMKEIDVHTMYIIAVKYWDVIILQELNLCPERPAHRAVFSVVN